MWNQRRKEKFKARKSSRSSPGNGESAMEDPPGSSLEKQELFLMARRLLNFTWRKQEFRRRRSSQSAPETRRVLTRKNPSDLRQRKEKEDNEVSPDSSPKTGGEWRRKALGFVAEVGGEKDETVLKALREGRSTRRKKEKKEEEEKKEDGLFHHGIPSNHITFIWSSLGRRRREEWWEEEREKKKGFDPPHCNDHDEPCKENIHHWVISFHLIYIKLLEIRFP